MTTAVYRFGEFVLDTNERQLRHGGELLKLNARYFDALVLLVREHGQLVSKDRFFETVWQGMVVGDEALTQCMKTLRRLLGDSAAQPRYIETVPKYGYRFVAEVVVAEGEGRGEVQNSKAGPHVAAAGLPRPFALVLGGSAGGASAGLIGGLIYGYAIALTLESAASGAAVVFSGIVALCAVVGGLGAFGVCLGVLLGEHGRRGWHLIACAASGGMVVGGVSNLVGLDAFALVLEVTPEQITGAGEGAMMGAAVGLTCAFGGAPAQITWRAALACAIAGLLIVGAGGVLMAGSLDALAA
ncbi:MAG TPA: transcriptional regulator, partial [Pseudorhizobium sp.]|nr:transcriptional regulator [Pseudorhizobium sp.]